MGITRFAAIVLVLMGMILALLLIYQSLFSTFYTVESGSMSPALSTGDAVVISDVNPDDIQAGQVIVFKDWERTDTFIIHRVVAVEDSGYCKYFTTKGDANSSVDPVRTPQGSVVGTLLVNVPRLGTFLEDLRSPLGFAGAVAVPIIGGLALALAYDIEKRKSGNRRVSDSNDPGAQVV